MAKFIVGVLVGLFSEASATAYGAGASRSGTLSGWAVSRPSATATVQTHLD
jgi:hypothetical protein